MNCFFGPLRYLGGMNFRRFALLFLVASGSLIVASCNTITGVGKDLQRAGEGLENTSEGRDW